LPVAAFLHADQPGEGIFVFMWVQAFYGCHKTAKEGNAVLASKRFLASVSVWDKPFSSHAQHGSMQRPPRCGCGSMLTLFFSAQESKDSNEQRNTVGH
jgi:hypothetical protein